MAHQCIYRWKNLPFFLNHSPLLNILGLTFAAVIIGLSGGLTSAQAQSPEASSPTYQEAPLPPEQGAPAGRRQGGGSRSRSCSPQSCTGNSTALAVEKLHKLPV